MIPLPLPKKLLSETAQKVAEVHGLLTMLKTMCKRATSLTLAEQDTFAHTLENASDVLWAAARDVNTAACQAYAAKAGRGNELTTVDPR